MLNILKARLAFGNRTAPVPGPGEIVLGDGFRGLPSFAPDPAAEATEAGAAACPTGAFQVSTRGPAIDLGTCLFCPECTQGRAGGALSFTQDHRLAATSRDALLLGPGGGPPRLEPLEEKRRRLFGGSLKLRQVSAGGCNGCEAELIVTGTVVFDLGRFGVQFVASPRHADGLVVTGPVSNSMKLALEKTYAALPEPKLLIACGACAIGGGPFRGSPEANDGVGSLLPVDLWVPGCPPHPWTIVDGILRLLGRTS